MKFGISSIKSAAVILGLGALLIASPAHADRVHIAGNQTTFYTVAKKYGVEVAALMEANPKINPLNLYPGLRLVIPGSASGTSSASAGLKAMSKAPAVSLAAETDSKTVEAWGKTYNYEKTLQVKATAYSSAASENGQWGAVDYFGNPLKLGTIAVDPDVIPLGTKVLVTGYSHPGLPKQAFVATASDKGSAIQGNRIDIFIPGSQSFVSEFGYQYVQLYIIK
ncbi:3D (Asp-Asp-Asp) domain-containing protein [Paenibacillus sophorae]|uniref:3D (Asp-Asp-Asp) domain-containing protein n=1 Tax=Paenibacillus sophorae TaxID=1333845 RepID=A0A1H8FV57_9BACL|nr:3D domain-containing protein [Paenibacillus sophorae]QWU18431.1 LysM peptidoglycan-binding domain-containing protein [Paenibacillus sophorae]SEN35424.1 3D (Asp-Asp-Asp) domain-containing protein [Paenibacillus sophorae]